jgi:hypothetical protein
LEECFVKPVDCDSYSNSDKKTEVDINNFSGSVVNCQAKQQGMQ